MLTDNRSLRGSGRSPVRRAMARPGELGSRANKREGCRSAASRPPRALRPFRVGQPEASCMVGKTADTMNRHRHANCSISANVLAILSISLLTSNVASRMTATVMAKKNPNAVALGRLGGKARAASLSDAERKASASKAGKARNEKLSAAERSRIAKLAVQARERKRKRQRKEKSA